MGVYNYYLEVLFKQGKLKNKVLCYAPVDGMAFGQLKEKYPYFEFIPVREGKVTFIGDTKAQFLKLRHGAANYGVRLTDDETGRKLVYSGDTNVCENLEKLLSSCDLWLGGAPFIGEEYQAEGGHLSVEVMQSLAEKYSVHAVVTHLCPQHDAKDYEKACTSELLSVAKTFRSYHV
jgi:ribonuclease BN (tRNA processing enzyme)